MLKVLIIIPTLDRSGAEKQFSLLATRLPRDAFDVRLLALSRGGPLLELLEEHAVPVRILDKRGKFDPRTLRRIRSEIREWQPDVLLSCLFAGNAYARLATLGLRHRPVTVISERCVDSWKAGWQLWLDRRLASRTDCLVANSASVARFYEEQGFPAEKITVIPNGVETPPVPAITREEFLRERQLPDEARLVAYVGRLAPQKRLKELIWAAQLLRQADERAHLLLIGDGPQRRELELYARDVECTGHVHFLGHREDAASLLHLVDVFWLGSEFEGMSNSLMEAMACGKPVVVSDIPPNRELVEPGREGWVVQLGDSIGYAQYTRKLLEDPPLARTMGDAGRMRMDQSCSIETMVETYADLMRHRSGKKL